MTFLLKLVKGPLKRILKKKINDETLQKKAADLVVSKIDNDKLDQKLSDEEKYKIFNLIYDALQEVLDMLVDKI